MSTAANVIRFGDPLYNTNLAGGYGAWQNISDSRFKNDVREDVPGLAFINALRPVTYRFDIAAFHDFNGVAKHMRDSADAEEQRAYAEAMANAPNVRQTGFLARKWTASRSHWAMNSPVCIGQEYRPITTPSATSSSWCPW
ncbi:MAG: tail fiber domain-containing protein [Flavobacteriales bacterium]|nr:tail fiber domain-containing protein [Flavobacteriales bacterium]